MKRRTDQLDQLSRCASWFFLLTIVALSGFLRFYRIGSKGLWIDGAFSVWMDWQPVGEMLGWLVKIDQHPPLCYTLLHFWMAFGDSAAIVRALSALLSTLTIPVIYLLGRRLSDGGPSGRPPGCADSGRLSLFGYAQPVGVLWASGAVVWCAMMVRSRGTPSDAS